MDKNFETPTQAGEIFSEMKINLDFISSYAVEAMINSHRVEAGQLRVHHTCIFEKLEN